LNRSVLIVDDDRDMVSTLSDILELHGWHTIRAYDGTEAIDMVAAHDVSVVLMDVRMPKMDGLEALHEIKQRRPTARVVLMTAFSGQDLLRRAEREGALTILRKPLQLPELLDTLESAATERQSVLVVDDDASYLRSLGETLRNHGIDSVEATNLPEALAHMRPDNPCTVLLNLSLGHVDALTNMLAIRQLNPTVLLILYSGHAAELSSTMRDAPSGLIDAAFTKPVPLERLLRLLNA
jgi:two-component system response regulator (stage 0 sporulation protein F)